MNLDNWWREPTVSGGKYIDPTKMWCQPGNGVAFAFPTCPTFHGGMELSESDREILAEVNRRAGIVLTQIRAVVDRDTTAFFLWGSAGHGKTYLVEGALRDCDRVKWTTGDISAKGLFNLFMYFPDHIHVFQDMEKVYGDIVSKSILRAACDTGKERVICWEKDGEAREAPVIFTGGVIIIGNDNPRGKDSKLRAVASRFAPQEWRLTDPELAAMIRDIALNRDYGLSTSQQWEVAEFVIEEMGKRPSGVSVDFRTYCNHAIPAYIQWKEERMIGDTDWHDVVKAKIMGGPKDKTRASRLERERIIACEVYLDGTDTESRHKLWKERTGLEKSAFHARLREARESGLFDEIAKKRG